MPVDYQIRAEVVDLRGDAPLPSDRFLVDTNVWFWMTYSRAGQTAQPYQVNAYPPYIRKVLTAKGRLYRCNLSFAELAHSVERAELDIYNRARTPAPALKPKEYRHNEPAQRVKVVAEIQSAWGQVKTLAQPLDVTIDEPLTDAAVGRLPAATVDGYDLFILEVMSQQGIQDVITDDGDFATVSGLRVFSANANVIGRARAAGKLAVR